MEGTRSSLVLIGARPSKVSSQLPEGLALGACRPAPRGGADKVRLAFCGQLLCVVPYEVARARGHFAAEHLDVELVYTRGGNAAMQALVGGAVEYAGTSFDVALQAAANGASIRRFASTGRLPLFALAVAPGRSSTVAAIKDLKGTTVGVSALGNADHALLLYLLDRAGLAAADVYVATIGTNVFDALRLGLMGIQLVDAAPRIDGVRKRRVFSRPRGEAPNRGHPGIRRIGPLDDGPRSACRERSAAHFRGQNPSAWQATWDAMIKRKPWPVQHL